MIYETDDEDFTAADYAAYEQSRAKHKAALYNAIVTRLQACPIPNRILAMLIGELNKWRNTESKDTLHHVKRTLYRYEMLHD